MRINAFTKRSSLVVILIPLLFGASCYGPSPSSNLPVALTNTPTPYLTLSPSIDEIAEIRQVCLSMQVLPEIVKAKLDGIAVTFNIDSPDFFLGFITGEAFSVPFPLSQYNYYGGKISPDSQWIAFEIQEADNNNNSIESKLVIFDGHGNIISTMSWMDAWGGLVGWLDNSHLLIESKMPFSGSMFIVDPFAGQFRELFLGIPNLYTDYPPAIWSVLPNSDLTLALYPNATSHEEKVGYSLWDIVSNQKIWQKNSRVAPNAPPVWSPDNGVFALIVEDAYSSGSQEEVAVIDAKGNLLLQSKFSSSYPYVFIGDFMSWSSDGRYLAFWMNTDLNENTTKLTVLDLKENIIVDYCVESYGSGNKLIWMQNKQWLITWSDEKRNNILVDVWGDTGYVLTHPSNRIIDGWMETAR